MKRLYKIAKHNSTVCGGPGRYFDWSLFDWNQESNCDFGDMRYSTESEYIPENKRGKLIGIQKAPKVYTDDCLIAKHCQYLHVPYNWSENGTIYRVRPNDCMYTGEIYRGHLVKRQRAIKKDGIWYWELEFENKSVVTPIVQE